MNWPKSIGWLKGPMSDGRKDRDSTALASLAITACHAPGIAMFTAAAARERTMSTVPTRAATARWRSVQSSWATAHPNSRPLAMTNVPVRKIAAGTWRTSALSTPQTRKPANHHCPGRLRSGRLPTIRRSGIVTAHSTTRPSSRYPTWGICHEVLDRADEQHRQRRQRGCGVGTGERERQRHRAAQHHQRRQRPGRSRTSENDRCQCPHPHAGRTGWCRAGRPTCRTAHHNRWRIRPGGYCRHRDGPRRPSIATPVLDAPRRPRSTLPCREPAGLAPAGRGSCSTPTGSEHTRPQVPVVPRLG